MNNKFLGIFWVMFVFLSEYAVAQRTLQDFSRIDTTDSESFFLDTTAFFISEVRARRPEEMMKPDERIIDTGGGYSTPTVKPYIFSNNGIVPTNASISYGYSVGEIPFTEGISDIGSTNTNVPITVYQDPSGFTPQVSLAYNSGSGNGYLGMGWSITGLSAISRVNRNLYYDGYVDGVKCNKDDAFMLDGVRLMRIKDEGTRIYYRTVTGNVKAIAEVSEGNIAFFTVLYPNGNKLEYKVSDGLVFYVSRAFDHKGHRIDYSYISNGKGKRIDKIDYSVYNGKVNASIKFVYTKHGLSTSPRYYSNGQEYVYDDLLTEVQSWYHESLLRKYNIYYTYKGMAFHVSKIGCSAGNSNLNPLYFYYGDTDKKFSLSMAEIPTHAGWEYEKYGTQSKISFSRAQFGRERRDAIISFPNKFPYEENCQFNHEDPYIRNVYKEDDGILIYKGLINLKNKWSSADYIGIFKVGEGFVDAFAADIDKVPGDEFVKVNNVAYKVRRNEYVDSLFFTVSTYENNVLEEKRRYGFSLTDVLYTVEKESFSSHKIPNLVPKSFYVGDFDGDGKSEVMVVTSCRAINRNIDTKVFIIDLENGEIKYNSTNPFAYVWCLPGMNYGYTNWAKMSDKLMPMDYNGDGKTDIVLVKQDGTYFYTFDVVDGEMKCSLAGKDSNLRVKTLSKHQYLVGDYNGDGLFDLLVSPEEESKSTNWTIYANTGKERFEAKNISIVNYKDLEKEFFIQDINMDGQSDLIVRKKSDMDIYCISNFGVEDHRTLSISEKSAIVPVNIYSKNCWYNLFTMHNDGKHLDKIGLVNGDDRSKLLTGIVSSLGVSTKYTYTSIADEDETVYKKTKDVEFPYMSYNGNMFLTSKKQVYYKDVLYNTFKHQYYDAIVHRQGRGFCGFSELYSTDAGYHYSNKQFDCMNYSNLIMSSTDKGKYQYEYSVSEDSNKILTKHLDKQTFKDYLNGTVTTTVYGYDEYDNVTKCDVNYTESDYSYKTESQKSYLNIDDDNTNILGLIQSETEQSTRVLIGAKKEVTYEYDDNLYLRKKHSFIRNKHVSTEIYDYDSNTGNVCSTSVRSYNAQDYKTDSCRYDLNTGLLKCAWDNMGFKTSYYYDNNSLLDRVTDYKNNLSCYTYDEWGREKSRTLPDGTVVSTNLEWNMRGGKVLYIETITETGKPTMQKHYDVWGHVVRSGEQCFDGSYIWTDSEYDKFGRAVKVSYPYKTSASKFVTTDYDYKDRVKTVRDDCGLYETYKYDSLSCTVIKSPGLTVTKTYNAMGDLLTVNDGYNTITYSYNGDGAIRNIKAPGNITTTFSYDSYNRKTSVTDPSAGKLTYSYDESGRLSKFTDARGKKTVYTYDNYDRIVKKEFAGEGSLELKYDEEGNLILEQNSNGLTKCFSYDNLGRISTCDVSGLDGKEFNTKYHYNGGNVSKVDYSNQYDSIVSEIYTYRNGSLTAVDLSNGKNVYKLKSEDGQGREHEYYTGKLYHSRDYDETGHIISLMSKVNERVLLNYGYGCGVVTGEVWNRSDLKRNLTEKFSYDQFERLVTFGDQTIKYALNGNITENSLVGKYNYDGTKPYAVSSIEHDESYIPHVSQYLGFNAQGRVSYIREYDNKNISADFIYDSDGDRIRMIHTDKKNPAKSFTKYYFGDKYELKTDATSEKEILFLGGDAYDAQSVYVRNSGDAEWMLYYILRDNQGSIMSVVDDNGNVVQEMSYDAWGNLRDPETWEMYGDDAPELFLGRGYTGHEHLQTFGLINMNARLYNPLMCRFISPDPYVQAPEDAQNFNRFSYCLNNPLKYSDKSGKFAITTAMLVGAFFSSIMNWGMNGMEFNLKGLSHFGVGAVAGAAGGALASGVNVAMAGGSFMAGVAGAAGGVSATGFWAGAASGASAGLLSGFISGAGSSWVNGNSFGTGLNDGLKSGGIGALSGGAIGGIVGGIDAVLKHTNFWTGTANLSLEGACTCSGCGNCGVGDEYIKNLERVKGKYVGKFEGVKVFETNALGDISSEYSAMTLPNKGIIAAKGVYTSGAESGIAMMQHEFGHVIESWQTGIPTYYEKIALPSLASCTRAKLLGDMSLHHNYWTETWANHLSKQYFGKAWLGNSFKGYPARPLSPVFRRFLGLPACGSW